MWLTQLHFVKLYMYSIQLANSLEILNVYNIFDVYVEWIKKSITSWDIDIILDIVMYVNTLGPLLEIRSIIRVYCACEHSWINTDITVGLINQYPHIFYSRNFQNAGYPIYTPYVYLADDNVFLMWRNLFGIQQISPLGRI